jgi:hypothetical protein
MNILTVVTDPDLLTELRSFGVAGLMGVMWLWERRNSQRREQQLDETHARITSDRVALDQLISVVRQNAEALTGLTSTQQQLVHQLSAAGGVR